MLLENKGFSIIEVIMVILILAIISVFLIPLWPSNTVNVSAQADQIVADLLYARSLSMYSGTRYNLKVLSTTTYNIQNSSGTAIKYPGTGKTTNTLNTGITFGTLTNLPSSLVAFDGKGIPYTNTSIPGTQLSALASIPLTSGSTTVTVYITPKTGWIYKQ